CYGTDTRKNSGQESASGRTSAYNPTPGISKESKSWLYGVFPQPDRYISDTLEHWFERVFPSSHGSGFDSFPCGDEEIPESLIGSPYMNESSNQGPNSIPSQRNSDRLHSIAQKPLCSCSEMRGR